MNKEQFSALVLAGEKSMYRVAKSILHQEQDCEDAVQSAILSAYAKLDTLREEQYFQTWLTRILINECYSVLRRRRNTVAFEDYMETEAANGHQEYTEIYLEIAKLEDTYRLPFVLHYVEGYSVRETADILQISEAAVRMRLLRSRRLLRKVL